MRRDRSQSSYGFDAFLRAAPKKFICARTPTTQRNWLTRGDWPVAPIRGGVQLVVGSASRQPRVEKLVSALRFYAATGCPINGMRSGPVAYRGLWDTGLTCVKPAPQPHGSFSPVQTLARSGLASVRPPAHPTVARHRGELARHSGTGRLARVSLTCVHGRLRIGLTIRCVRTSRGTSKCSLLHNSSAASYTPIRCA